MKETRIIMGMPITIEIVDDTIGNQDLETVFAYFAQVDETFSTYKETSEISRINAGILTKDEWSDDMITVMEACEKTKQETNGFFDIDKGGLRDPSGYVKGWAISNAARTLGTLGYRNYYVEAGGDIQAAGTNGEGTPWTVGIRNPFSSAEIVKRVFLANMGMATSGTYVRGQHIYDPHQPGKKITDILSLTVLGPDIVDADRYATAAFAMGKEGITFIASLTDFEAYMIDSRGIATFTAQFTRYVLP
jgi:thiamine biosynthesis lipoprotein